MDTLSFGFLDAADDSLGKAREEFERREYASALLTIAGLSSLVQARVDVLELKAGALQALGKFVDALAVWEEVLRADPGNKKAPTQLQQCHARVGQEETFKEVNARFRAAKYAETLALLEAGPPGWLSHPEFHRIKALSHERLSQFDAALQSWKQLLALTPANVEALVHVPVCQSALGKTDEAEQGFREVAERFPTSVPARFNWIFFRLEKRGVREGLQPALLEIEQLCWSTANSPEFKAQLDSFRSKLLAICDVADIVRVDGENVLQLHATAPRSTQSLRAIYEQFEPMGNNCEFGDAQRKHGAEPLALFRWTAIHPDNLVRLLAARLGDYDVPEHYRLEQNHAGEYLLKEDVYLTASHTRMQASQVKDAQALLAQLARRQSFLKRKFLETAEEGRKVFVYKYNERLTVEQMDGIQKELAALGARKILFVMRAQDADAPGTLRIDRADRVVGFLSDFMPNTRHDEWDAIVSRAHSHFHAHFQ